MFSQGPYVDLRRSLLWMSVLFMAMAFLESAVVVYLRALYCTDGTAFPSKPMDPMLITTEIGREVATLVMLLAPGALLTRSALQRLAWFSFGFGLWDLFYYIWLKVLVDWPASLLEADLLFLLPWPWIGPVWAPCVISCGLITFAILVLVGLKRDPSYRISPAAWALLASAAVLLAASFTLRPYWSGVGAYSLMDMPEAHALSGLFVGPLFAAGTVLGLLGLWAIRGTRSHS